MDRPPSAIPADLVLAQEPYGDDGPQWIVAQAEAEIVMRYGNLDGDERGLTAAMFDPPNGAFLVARRGRCRRTAARRGRGARHPPGVGQIRAPLGRPRARGQGVGRALMAAVEDAARELGLTDLRLGTGDGQPEAVALYASIGLGAGLRRPGRPAECPTVTSGS